MTINQSRGQSIQTPRRIRPIAAFNDNYIWLIDDGQFACVVDPGDATPVIQVIEQDQLQLTYILLTHHHHDHVGGVKTLVNAYGAQVWGPANEVLPLCDHALIEGDEVQIDQPSLRFKVLDIPGHTAGHIALVGNIDGQSVVFCGDTLFAGGCGRIFEGTPAQMFASLTKLANLPSDTAVYCAHEYTLANLKFALAVEPDNLNLVPRYKQALNLRDHKLPTVPSTIALELQTNPFLRVDVKTVQAAALNKQPHLDHSPVNTFAILRSWKNDFK